MKLIKKKLLLLVASILVLSSCCEEQNSDRPKSAISYKRAQQLQKEYITTRANFLNEHLNSVNHFKKEKGLTKSNSNFIEDVRDITFDINTLKQYIAYVEKEAKKKGLKGLGLRVYLGAYPKNDVESKDPGFATVFFMPTHQPKLKESNANNFFYWYNDDVIRDIDGLNMGQAGKPPKDLE